MSIVKPTLTISFIDNIKTILENRDLYDLERTYGHKESAPFNSKCEKCGFPNYDYQVSIVTHLCRECEKQLTLAELFKRWTISSLFLIMASKLSHEGQDKLVKKLEKRLNLNLSPHTNK